MYSALRCELPHCAVRAGRASSFWNILHPAAAGFIPADAKPNDLVHWQQCRVSRPDAAKARASFISSDLIDAGFGKSFLVRNPDGHAVQFVEK